MTRTEIAFQILKYRHGIQGDPKYQALMLLLNEVDENRLDEIVKITNLKGEGDGQ